MCKKRERKFHKWAGAFHRCLPARLRCRVCWDEVKHYFHTGVRPEAAAARYAQSKGEELIPCV